MAALCLHYTIYIYTQVHSLSHNINGTKWKECPIWCQTCLTVCDTLDSEGPRQTESHQTAWGQRQPAALYPGTFHQTGGWRCEARGNSDRQGTPSSSRTWTPDRFVCSLLWGKKGKLQTAYMLVKQWGKRNLVNKLLSFHSAIPPAICISISSALTHLTQKFDPTTFKKECQDLEVNRYIDE